MSFGQMPPEFETIEYLIGLYFILSKKTDSFISMDINYLNKILTYSI